MPRPNIDEIRKRLEAATPGPWLIDEEEGRFAIAAGEEHPRTYICHGYDHRDDEYPNADLIAHAPTDIRELLQYVQELEHREVYKGVYEKLSEVHDDTQGILTAEQKAILMDSYGSVVQMWRAALRVGLPHLAKKLLWEDGPHA